MKKEFIIIGGGVAGLCAANRLAELGLKPLLIDAGSYPAHKICGEFFSPECLSLLKQRHIIPTPIKRMHLRTVDHTLNFSFPSSAGGLSHWEFDSILAERACALGAEIRTHTKVQALHSKQPVQDYHEIELENGESIQAHTLIIATGRIPHLYRPPINFPYIGIKAHFENIPIEDSLEMFSFNGSYLGIAPIEDRKFNVACLAVKKKVEQFPSLDLFIESLTAENALLKLYLKSGKNLFAEWMQSPIPEFGIKKTPNWPDSYFIGDSAGTIPPACGNGLSMAISSGFLAADYAAKRDFKGFKKTWHQCYASPIFWGKMLHRLMLNPLIGNPLFQLTTYFPSLIEKVFNKTR